MNAAFTSSFPGLLGCRRIMPKASLFLENPLRRRLQILSFNTAFQPSYAYFGKIPDTVTCALIKERVSTRSRPWINEAIHIFHDKTMII